MLTVLHCERLDEDSRRLYDALGARVRDETPGEATQRIGADAGRRRRETRRERERAGNDLRQVATVLVRRPVDPSEDDQMVKTPEAR